MCQSFSEFLDVFFDDLELPDLIRKELAKITDWLKGLNNGAALDGPMLLIDDEADNASVNTNVNPDQICLL
jgi:uncharacterized sporulation protein YeaH/YhbH (DUF444 family)